MRNNNRAADELRPIKITRNYTKFAEGSAFIECGNTRVLCTASIEETVPKFLKNTGQGWVTAEYGMLPRATNTRNKREASQGKQASRSIEIQRLIGRSLRAAVDLKALGEVSIIVDCDVIQADAGTRTAAITAGCIALKDAISVLIDKNKLKTNPFKQLVGAISVGICDNLPILDLDYDEDSKARADFNVVMLENGTFIEIQGTAENGSFTKTEFDNILDLAKLGITQLFELQKSASK